MATSDPKPTFRHRALCLGLARLLIPELRKVAKFHGYALTVHGSQQRDIDLVAIPWVHDAAPADALAKAIQLKVVEIAGMTYTPDDGWDELMCQSLNTKEATKKPHGRLAYAFRFCGSGPYIDLSVMPREES